MVEKILRILPPIFEHLVVTLEEHTNMSMFTIDETQASLINHEHRLNRTQTTLEGAFAAHSSISHGRSRGKNNSRERGRISSKGGCGRSPANVAGRGENQNPSKPSGHRFDKQKIQCHYCKKFGHYAYECKKKQYDQGRKITNQSTSTITLIGVMLMASTSPIECNVVQEFYMTYGT